MSYKRFFFSLCAVCFLALGARLFASWVVDPIGIWGAPIVRGFNHYKFKQGSYLDVYKPYEYMREKPDVLYIGASQMYVGFATDCSTHSGKKVYTLGLSSLSLPDMREYLRFVYKVHKPEVIYMGIAPESFEAKSFYRKRSGFSKKRLERLAGNLLEYYWQAIEDSMSLHDICWLTVKTSRARKGNETQFLRGWDTLRGRAEAPHPKSYYSYVWQTVTRDFKDWKEAPEAMDCLRDIVTEAREAGVPLVTFFTPCSVDRNAMMHLMGCEADYQRPKREAAQITPVYDFDTVSELTTNRQAYFYDAWHFRASLGEKLKSCLESGNPEPYGYLLTAETVDNVLEKENEAWEKWAGENQEYLKTLQECIDTGRKPEAGDLKKYIGF